MKNFQPEPGLVVLALKRTYKGMTDGQRWTTGLVVFLLVVFVTYGQRSAIEAVSLELPPVAETRSPSGRPGRAASARDVTIQPTPAAGLFTSAPASSSSLEPGDGELFVSEVVDDAGPPQVVALVRTGDGLPGHDDASIAAAFVPDVGVPVTVLPLDTARSDMCQATKGAGAVVLAGFGLPRPLRDCLVEVGAVVLSYDHLGSSGSSVSTRLGATPAIVQAASRGGAKGKVGIAATAAVEPEAKAAAAALAKRGMTVSVAVVPEEPSNAGAIGDAIRLFAGAGVEWVVFALPVADQSKWLGLEALLAFRPRHIVADVADAPVNEGYLPVSEGTLGVFSTGVPWFARAHGETPDQRSCRERFETKAGSSVNGSVELAKVFAWCQHTRLLRSALTSGKAIDVGLRDLRGPSPLTSNLAVVNGVYGPMDVASVVWRANCGCWNETKAYASRGDED